MLFLLQIAVYDLLIVQMHCDLLADHLDQVLMKVSKFFVNFCFSRFSLEYAEEEIQHEFRLASDQH